MRTAEREMILMIVDALWNERWIRRACEDYEAGGIPPFDVWLSDWTRRTLGLLPPKERPAMRGAKVKANFERWLMQVLQETMDRSDPKNVIQMHTF
jgi:hypothetical protein